MESNRIVAIDPGNHGGIGCVYRLRRFPRSIRYDEGGRRGIKLCTASVQSDARIRRNDFGPGHEAGFLQLAHSFAGLDLSL